MFMKSILVTVIKETLILIPGMLNHNYPFEIIFIDLTRMNF